MYLFKYSYTGDAFYADKNLVAESLEAALAYAKSKAPEGHTVRSMQWVGECEVAPSEPAAPESGQPS